MATACALTPASAAVIRAPRLQLVRSNKSLKVLPLYQRGAGRIHASLSTAAPLSSAKPDDLVASILSKVCAMIVYNLFNFFVLV